VVGAGGGKVKQAVAHREAGRAFVVGQGGEGGGDTGEVGSIVLWPQMIDALGDTLADIDPARYDEGSATRALAEEKAAARKSAREAVAAREPARPDAGQADMPAAVEAADRPAARAGADAP